jgi:hypothetical protein
MIFFFQPHRRKKGPSNEEIGEETGERTERHFKKKKRLKVSVKPERPLQ